MMRHVVEASKKIYEGTQYQNSFMIFHDALSAWWEKEAQEFLRT